jgi:hypothetical protein
MGRINEYKYAKLRCKYRPDDCRQCSLIGLNIRKKRSHHHQAVDMAMKAGSKNFLNRLIRNPLGIPVIGQQIVKEPLWRYAKRKQQQEKCRGTSSYDLRLVQCKELANVVNPAFIRLLPTLIYQNLN